MNYCIVKRVMDFLLSLVGIILLSPLFLLLVMAIKIDSKGPVLFKQKRVGIHKSYFMILKFRTMFIDTPKDMPTHLLKNPDQYITKVGKFLRKTSLDELPQIINILKGEMAIVGPRPALWNQYDLIEEREKVGANDVLPGLTGWAQVNGRDELEIGKKAKLDGEYVKKMSLMFDIKCILRTCVSVAKSDGVVEGGTGNLRRNPLTIAIIVNHNITIYNFRKELLQCLIAQGYRVIVILPVIEETQKLIDIGCEVIDVPVERRETNPIHDLALMRKYVKLLKEIRPDLVLTYTIKPNVYGGMACKKLKIPYMSTITGLGTAIEGGGILSKISLLLYKIGLSRATKVFFQNKENEQLFTEQCIAPDAHILVIGSGVHLSEYEDIVFPTEESPVEFIFISRVMKTKGIDNFLGMAERIKERYPETEFHILGFCEEAYQKELEKLTQKGTIYYHGLQKDIRPIMRRCQCLIHPSFHEGMSNVCMEASASGRAVIASDIPGCREIVEHQRTGYLVPVDNTEELIKTVESYLSLSYNDRKMMGLRGKTKMQNEFDREKVVQIYMNEIRNIIEKAD